MENLTEIKPKWVEELDECSEIRLDLGHYVRHGMEPLPSILAILKEIRPCQVLHLMEVERPEILCEVLKDHGFEHYAQRRGRVWDLYLRRCL